MEGVACCCCLLSYMPTRILRRLPGTIPWRPWREQSHQPSNPCVSRSNTVMMSPLRKDSSSGDSATLSYNALANTFCRRRTDRNIEEYEHTRVGSCSHLLFELFEHNRVAVNHRPQGRFLRYLSLCRVVTV